MRLALYLTPICAFLVQMHHVLQFMRCQTSPDFALLRWNDPMLNLAVEFGGEGGFLYDLSSTLLFWEEDASCCAARSMSLAGVNGDLSQLRGSISLLFWFFVTLCASQLFDTLSCALQGKQPVPETGMTIFEHSLAFAECETMLTTALGFSTLGLSRPGQNTLDAAESMSRLEILQRLNVPPELLLVCLISCFSHLSSATLAVTGLRSKVRLVNTGIWSCCYMVAFIWSFISIVTRPLSMPNEVAILRFPTVCIVGFIPHLLILVGIVVCGCIYGLALMVTALSVPGDVATGLTFRQRLGWAYRNLQANVQFSAASAIRIRMSEDFYTTLLKIGFNVLTAASEAVYLNEGSRIHVAQMTWVERKRIDDLGVSMEQRKRPKIPSELLGGEIAKGLGHVDTQHGSISESPYARERKSRPTSSGKDRRPIAEMDTGLGMVQRRSRMQLTYEYASGIFWLVVSIQAQVALKLLRRLGVERQPAWLAKAAGVEFEEHRRQDHAPQATPGRNEDLEFWLIADDGVLRVPENDKFDVEVETRRRLEIFGGFTNEDNLSDHLYRWWRNGGWFGSIDSSGEYQDTTSDDDTTSMISMSTNASTPEDWEDDGDSGRRTPTQRHPYVGRSREVTPDAGLDLSVLSRLLNPQSSSEREEARLLSYSLQAVRPTTRSQYRREQDRDRAQVLTGLRRAAATASNDEEEERDLEHFILTQRAQARAKVSTGTTWASGAEGMGEGGPQCVVCQSTPRTVLVWPCGCLSMCDDCRVGLAARNYTKCICCRSDVAAYSRLYVP